MVKDLNEAPAFESIVDLDPSVQENQNFVSTLSATDQDADRLLIIGKLLVGTIRIFQLSASSGNYVDLNFISNPDFEYPLDSEANNTYEVIVKVWDDDNVTVLKGKQETFTVTVTDVNDYLRFLSPPVL